ncbi:MAG: hypothetical protein SFW67_08070 [Myxococcaceae bacterium]|nr:hypothetical protein [Myxococcaceae bacterium]
MLDALQAQLETLYGIRCAYRAKDFLVDAEAARALGGTGRSREELLVADDGESLDLALYLEPALLERVSRHEADAEAMLNEELPGFCEVTEGVSHFVYVAQTAQLSRRVSMLELEAQAEVDKFAVCTLLRWGTGVTGWAQRLIGTLFERVRYHEALSAPERWRYVEANRLAKRYCTRLLPAIRDGRLDRLLSELRHTYRLGAEAKLAWFAR